MQFIDRKAKYPGRWTMKKSDGTSEVVTLVRNDEPIVEGTPLNANTLNALGGTDTTLSVEGMAADAKMTGDAVGQLKEDLDYLSTKKISSEDTSFFEHSINLFDYTDRDRVIDNAYMDKGVVTEYNGWSCTEYIRVEPNTEYAVVRCYTSSTGWDYTRDNYCDEFDIYKKYIRTFNTKAPFTTSENCYYIRLSARYLYGTVNLTGRMVSKYVDIESFLGSMDASLYVPEYHNIVADNVSNMESKVSNMESKVSNMELSAITKSSGIAYVLRKNEIPSYYTESPSEPTSFEDIEYLERKIKNVPDGKHFVFITDPHYPVNQKHSTSLVAYVINRLGIDTVVMGGDILDREDTKYKGAIALEEYTTEMLSAIGNKMYLPVLGNHDVNTANTSGWTAEQLEVVTLPYAQVYNRMFASLDGKVMMDEAVGMDAIGLDSDVLEDVKNYMKLHYYFDDCINKIRYINLVTGTTNSGVVKTVFGLSGSSELLLQYDWLYDALLSVPKGYDVVLCGHAIVTWGATASAKSDQVKSYCLGVCKMLSALKTKGICTINNNKTNSYLTAYYANGNHQYDFTNANDIGKILVLGGDVHWDCQCVTYNKDGEYVSETITDEMSYTGDAIIAIVTQTDSQGRSSYSGKDYASKVHTMTIGTVTEQCFDIVTIGDGITFTRIGAGNDRHYSYN